MTVRIITGDCLAVLPQLAAEGVQAHAVVCDPPYGLGFMGKQWDAADNVAFRPETWAAVLACMRPGAHLVAFGGTRTFHRMAVAIEDAGFEYRDTLAWMYGSGFPKSHDVSKGIDKAAGAVREVVGQHERSDYAKNGAGFRNLEGITEGRGSIDITAPATPEAAAWAGWGTALKPAFEPIILARKPLTGTVAANVLAHGCGALNIDACRVEAKGRPAIISKSEASVTTFGNGLNGSYSAGVTDLGRWPANVLHDGSDEVEAAFAAFGEKTSGKPGIRRGGNNGACYGAESRLPGTLMTGFGDTGAPSRFFYCAKADASDRAGSKHPTVKPGALMRWLVQLITPPGGLVLDPFAGTGSTGLAADQLGMDAILIEQDATYADDARRKIASDAGMFGCVVPQ